MKQPVTLFDSNLSFNAKGIELSDKFEELVKAFIKDNSCELYNPIELQFVLEGGFRVQMDSLYLDMASDLYMESNCSLN